MHINKSSSLIINHIMIFKILFSLFITLIVIGCNSESREEASDNLKIISSKPKVKISPVKTSSFYTTITSNGKLNAVQKIDLAFEKTGLITKITVENGDYVKKGKFIASQEFQYLISEKTKNQETLQKAWLNMEDILLGFNYSVKDSANIPKNIFTMAKTRSGIAQAKNQIIQTNRQLKNTKLTAPFSGIVANVAAKPNTLSSLKNNVCTLINNDVLFAEFYILESEFQLVNTGDLIKVVPIALPNQVFTGEIDNINPVIDKNGLILVKAKIKNINKKLIDGMNVNISIQKEIKNVICFPKTAIVDRQDKKVVFTLENNKTKWNYVETGFENKDSIVIKTGLKIGDHVIIEGNINLAHNIEVELAN